MKPIQKMLFAGLATVALAVFGVNSNADDKSAQGDSFHGKVSSVDSSSQTITIGDKSYQVLPTTQITRNDQPAEFNDIKVGQHLSGRYKKSAENKMEVLSVDLGQATGGTRDTATSESGASFSGKISKVDTTDQTITVGGKTYQILPTTQMSLSKGGTASIDSLKKGQRISGTYKTSAEGKMEVLSLQVERESKR